MAVNPRWKDFTAALGAVLEWLPYDSKLIIEPRSAVGSLVQFAKWREGMRAEVGGRPPPKRMLRRLLSPPSDTERAEELAWNEFTERLAGTRWFPPESERSNPNWWCELPSSATRQDYYALAAEVTRIFGAELQLTEPSDLQYTAWHEQRHRDRDLELDSLGLVRFATP